MRKLAFVAALAVAAPLTMTTASASGFYVIDSATSEITNFRRIGGNLIPEINQYSNTNPFLLDPQDARNWPVMSATFGLWDPDNRTAPPPIVLNNAAVGGTINVVGGMVTEAEISQQGQLSLAAFQSFAEGAENGVVTDMVVNGLVWTYNPVTGQLNHQQAPGNSGYGVCQPAGAIFGGASGTQTAGQCSQLVAAVNSSGGFGQSTIANSWLNWDGLPDGYSVFDNQNSPPGTPAPAARC